MVGAAGPLLIQIVTVVLSVALLPLNAASADENPIYAELLGNGVVIGSGPGIKLPPPTMAIDGEAASRDAECLGARSRLE